MPPLGPRTVSLLAFAQVTGPVSTCGQEGLECKGLRTADALQDGREREPLDESAPSVALQPIVLSLTDCHPPLNPSVGGGLRLRPR